MTSTNDGPNGGRSSTMKGFSLLETLVAVAIIVLLMSAVFPFLAQSQKRFQGNEATSEATQSARAAMEVMTQEIGQAGFNPAPPSSTTLAQAVAPSGTAQCVTLNSIQGINPGDWLQVDSGANYELVQVLSTSNSNVYLPACPGPNQIQARFLMCHGSSCAPASPSPVPVISYNLPYGSGILAATGTSSDQRLEFFGDINQDGEVDYVVYSLNPVSPPESVTINGTVYTLYNLYRSATPVQFTSFPTPAGYAPPANSPASLFVPNVLYNAANASGPTGQPIFSYSTETIAVVPTTVTAVGTIVVTLCVAINPTSLETNVPQWFTMATQIRPLNINEAIAVNNAGGTPYLPPLPASLPMTFPTNYYQ